MGDSTFLGLLYSDLPHLDTIAIDRISLLHHTLLNLTFACQALRKTPALFGSNLQCGSQYRYIRIILVSAVQVGQRIRVAEIYVVDAM